MAGQLSDEASKCEAVWYSVLDYDTGRYSLVQYDTVWTSVKLWDTVWYGMIQC